MWGGGGGGGGGGATKFILRGCNYSQSLLTVKITSVSFLSIEFVTKQFSDLYRCFSVRSSHSRTTLQCELSLKFSFNYVASEKCPK